MRPGAAALQAVIIDLDGTMLDTVPDFEAALNGMRADLGLAPIDQATIKPLVGKGSEKLVRDTLLLDWDADRVDAAYDDALGVTAAFNLNILRHVNTLLGADFDIRAWRHHGFYNAARSRVEMHLEAVRDQEVRWPGGARRFKAGDCIHTENSYKYQQADAVKLLERSGFEATRIWTDPQCPFALIHAQAIPE